MQVPRSDSRDTESRGAWRLRGPIRPGVPSHRAPGQPTAGLRAASAPANGRTDITAAGRASWSVSQTGHGTSAVRRLRHGRERIRVSASYWIQERSAGHSVSGNCRSLNLQDIEPVGYFGWNV